MTGAADPLHVRAVAFDMDGVLIDSAPIIEAAWRTAAGSHGRRLTDDDLRRHVHGRPGRYAVEALFPAHSADVRAQIWRAVDDIEERSACIPIPGVLPLLRTLRTLRVPVALVTSSWPARIGHVRDTLGLRHTFAVVVDRTSTARGKPHPDPYLAAAAGLRLDPAKLLVFEDSRSGIEAALAAGARCVAVSPEPAQPPVLGNLADFSEVRVAHLHGRISVHGLGRPVVVDRP